MLYEKKRVERGEKGFKTEMTKKEIETKRKILTSKQFLKSYLTHKCEKNFQLNFPTEVFFSTFHTPPSCQIDDVFVYC